MNDALEGPLRQLALEAVEELLARHPRGFEAYGVPLDEAAVRDATADFDVSDAWELVLEFARELAIEHFPRAPGRRARRGARHPRQRPAVALRHALRSTRSCACSSTPSSARCSRPAPTSACPTATPAKATATPPTPSARWGSAAWARSAPPTCAPAPPTGACARRASTMTTARLHREPLHRQQLHRLPLRPEVELALAEARTLPGWDEREPALVRHTL